MSLQREGFLQKLMDSKLRSEVLAFRRAKEKNEHQLVPGTTRDQALRKRHGRNMRVIRLPEKLTGVPNIASNCRYQEAALIGALGSS